MAASASERRGMRLHGNDARGRERMGYGLHRCAHVICLWSREMEREQGAGGESTAGSLDAALTGLESDLSYLEELAADGVAFAVGDLDGMSERLTRVIAALQHPAA